MADPERTQRPQVVAHRGASAIQAEHTLGAYLLAIEQGADALECDVRLTADGHLVCVHDRDLRRVGFGRDAVVSTMDLAALEGLDVATWKNPWADLDDEADDPDPELGNVLTLHRLLAAVADHDRRIEVAIEAKHPTRYAGLVERRLVEALDRFGWAGAGSPARVMSFSTIALRRVRRLAPELSLVFLMDGATQWARARPWAEPDWIGGPGIELLRRNPDLIRRIRRRTPVHVWTVNEPADIDLCVELGVSAIITDRPAATLAHLDGLGL